MKNYLLPSTEKVSKTARRARIKRDSPTSEGHFLWSYTMRFILPQKRIINRNDMSGNLDEISRNLNSSAPPIISFAPNVDATIELDSYDASSEGIVEETEETTVHVMSKEDVEKRILQYEQILGMSSTEFLNKLKEGTAPDTFEAAMLEVLLRHQ